MKHCTPVIGSERAWALRPATRADSERIAAVWAAGWADGHLGRVPEALLAHRTSSEFHRRAIDRIPFTVVGASVGTDTVVGFVVVRDAEVEQLYVADGWRGTGVAGELLTAAERRIASSFEEAWLAVVAGNRRARRFYERHGWTDAGAFDNLAEAGDGTMLVPSRRYKKRVGGVSGQPA